MTAIPKNYLWVNDLSGLKDRVEAVKALRQKEKGKIIHIETVE